MKEIKPGYYSSMHEMVAELNTKIPAELKTINLHSDGFQIRFDYDSFYSKSIVTLPHGVSIKKKGSDLAMRLGFKENLRGPTLTVSVRCESTLTLSSSIEIEIWRHDICNL